MVSHLLQKFVQKKLQKIRIHHSENELLSKVTLVVFILPCRNEHITHSQWLTPREEHRKIFNILQGKCLHGQDSVELWYT